MHRRRSMANDHSAWHGSAQTWAARTLLATSALSGLAMPVLAQESDDVRTSSERLERQIERLQRELEELRDVVEQQREQVTAEPVEPAALGPRVEPGNEQVRLTLSGQVNRGLLFAHDGEDTEVFHVDNDNSSTRVRFIGEAALNEDISAGTVIEVQFESNSTAAISQDDERNVGPNNFTERKLELFFEHDDYGPVWLGQGDTASNGTSEVDLSGVAVVGYSGVADLAGGLQFRDDEGALSGVRIGNTFSNLDGLSRDDRIRYDTPIIAGFRGSASYIADDRWDAALRYNAGLGTSKFAAAAAYASVPDDEDAGFDQFNGSASLLLDSGLNFTAAGGWIGFDADEREDDGWFGYGKLGYIFRPFTFGATAVAVDYYYGGNIGADGDESQTVGLLAVQNVDEIATEFYAGGRTYILDRDDEDFDDIYALLTGARIKF